MIPPGLKALFYFYGRDRTMPRPKMTEEELKAHKKERNKAYYQRTKNGAKEKYQAKYKEAIKYIVSIGNITKETITEHLDKLDERYHSLVLGSIPQGSPCFAPADERGLKA